MKLLHWRQLGEKGPALICLHGLYGQGRNWNSIARVLSQRYRVYLPDLRNHGRSFHDPVWNYPAMAADVAELARHLGLERFALLGHSMGGKVAMQYALMDQTQSLSHLIVIDMSPKAYGADYHHKLLAALASLDLSLVNRRQDADQALESAIPEQDVRTFLLSNLERTEAGWRWQFNLPVIKAQIEQITASLQADQGPFTACPVLFAAGVESDYVKAEDLPAIQAFFPQARCEWIAGAGHWVHADQPEALINLIQDFAV